MDVWEEESLPIVMVVIRLTKAAAALCWWWCWWWWCGKKRETAAGISRTVTYMSEEMHVKNVTCTRRASATLIIPTLVLLVLRTHYLNYV